MTVSTTDSEVVYVSGGPAFPIPYRFLQNADIEAVLVKQDGTSETLTGAQYTLTGAGSQSGGTLTSSYAAGVLATPGASLTISRVMDAVQPTDLRNQGKYLAETHENVFDRLTMLIQQSITDFSRALLRPIGRNYYDAVGRQIKNVANPTEAQDAATMKWTGDFIAGIQGPINNAANIFYQYPDGSAHVVQDLSSSTGSAGIGYSSLGGVARDAQAKLREIVSRADYSTDGAFNSAALGKVSIDGAGRLNATVLKDDGTTTTLQAIASLKPPMVNVHIPTAPAFIDQFVDSFRCRGMLTDEVINITTERAITAAASKGQSLIAVPNNTNLVVGGSVVVRGVDGRYWPHIITSMTGTSLALFPALRADVDTNSRVERAWYNRAHPGKFYMRYLAQRIAYGLEAENPFVRGKRVAFVEYGSGTTNALGGLAVTTGATVTYFDPAPTGASGTVSTPPRFTFEKTAYVEFTASSTGYAQTGLFALKEYSEVQVTLSMGCDRPIKVTVLNEAGISLHTDFIINPPFVVTNYIAHQRYKLNFYTGNSTSCRIRFEAATANATSMALGSIEAINTQTTQGRIVSKENAVIVGLGDSWMAGDLVSTPEREPITQQLALEMPKATIINSGIGGQKIDQMLTRFDTDVAPYKPDYVVIITGTNEVYNPLSATFDPNAINQFISLYWQMLSKIQSIGARAIIIGPAPMPQSDADVPALPEWTLLDRSRVQYIRLMRAFSDRPNAS